MLPSTIAQVLTRLFALKWILVSLIQIASYAHMNEGNLLDSYFFRSCIPAFVYFVAGFVMWVFAPTLSKLLTTGCNDPLRIEGVTLEGLFAAVLLGLGVFFALDSFGTVVNWMHQKIITQRSMVDHPPTRGTLSDYAVASALLTMASGVALAATCRIWAKRLAQSHGETPPDRKNMP